MNNKYYNKYKKWKNKYLALKGGQKYYYHGSQKLIENYLEPKPSKVLEGDEAVFATNTKWLALIFIAHTTDSDIEIGFIDNIPYIMEQYPEAFNKFLNTGGYIYYVDPELFKSDTRLGMQQHEFISDNKVPIIKKEEIENIYKALKETEVNFISYEEKENCLHELLKKKTKKD
jgi:hypothetical protein